MAGKDKKSPKKTAKKDPAREDLVRLTMDMAADRGWEHVTLSDIAQEAGVSLADLFAHFEDKTDILVALGRMIDRELLENLAKFGPETSERDRLFDILMDRYDILNNYRDGLIAVLNSFKLDPKQAVISLPHLCRSMTWMLEAAEINTNGIRGAVAITGLTGLYIKGLRVWKTDDSPDLAKTMAAIDKDLGRIESLANSLGL